jgi:mlo protein
MAGPEGTGAEATGEMRSLALTPTWSVATVLTLLVASSLIIERSIHRLSNVGTPTPTLSLCSFFLSVSFNSWSEL